MFSESWKTIGSYMLLLQSNISGCVAARNSVKFGYPLRQCLEALRPICDEVVLAYDPTTDDGTHELALELRDELDLVLFESPWNMNNMDRGFEIGHQSQVAMEACSPATEWRLCVQQDEAFHEDDREKIWSAIAFAEWVDMVRNWYQMHDPAGTGISAYEEITGFDFTRLYFYGNLHTIRSDWEVKITRLTRKGRYTYDGFDGQNCMSITPECRNFFIEDSVMSREAAQEDSRRHLESPVIKALPDSIRRSFPNFDLPSEIDNMEVRLYHYSRIGDPNIISKRVRNVDSFFHAEENLPQESELPPYDFTTREYDSYAFTENPKQTNSELLIYQGTHPLPFAELYQEFE